MALSRCLIVLAALLFASAGCDSRRYFIGGLGLYVPKESSWCFNACEREYNKCLTSCGADMDCECACRPPQRQCLLSCPGAIQKKVSPELQAISDVLCPTPAASD